MFKAVFVLENFFGKGSRSEEGYSNVDDSNWQVDDVDHFEPSGHVKVNWEVPEKMSDRWEEDTDFEYLEDHSIEISSQIGGVWVPPEEIILVNPVLKDKHDDQDGWWKRSHQRVEAGHVDVDDEEGITLCEVEFNMLKLLIKLVLEKIYLILRIVPVLVDDVEDGAHGED